MKKLRVSFNNEQKLVKITPEFKKLIKDCCMQSLYEADFDQNSEISVSFVDNARIREINKEFRNIDAPTDVLSFPLLITESMISIRTADVTSLAT